MGKEKETKVLGKRLEKERKIKAKYKEAGVALPDNCPMCNKSNLVLSEINLATTRSFYSGSNAYPEIAYSDCRYVMLFRLP
jgi:hypothetical protein